MKSIQSLITFILIGFFFKYSRTVLLRPIVWFIGSIVVFSICIAGTVYSILREMPFFKYDRDEFGGVFIEEYFLKMNRMQYMGEGYIFSALVTICGILILMISQLDTLFKTKKQMRYASWIILGLFSILAYLIVLCYRFKLPSYGPPGFIPPNEFNKGSLMVDHGATV